MKIRVFEAFAGYGSQSLALEQLAREYNDFEIENVGISEIDRYAIQAYNTLHPNVKNYGDISKIDWHEVPDFDLFTYSFPCGLEGTKIITLNGYKNIEDILVDDYVLTHNNRFKKVVRTMSRISNHYYNIKAVGCHLKLTENHPMYVLRDGEEQWVKVKDLKLTDKLSYCIPNQENPYPLSNEYLWLLGRYVADGYINKYLYNSVLFAIGSTKEQEFIDNIPNNLINKFKITKKSCLEYRIADKTLQKYCKEFGIGALNKKIPQWIIDLPIEQAEAFLKGYLSGDGHLRYRCGTYQWMFSTVSKELFLGIQRLMIKVYGGVCSLYIRKDNRKSTFNDTYNGQLSLTKHLKQQRINDRIFVNINSIERINGDVQVFNMEVEDDNSYTCDNINVHNCTDVSNAGEQKGLEEGSGTRSSLLWECRKAIEVKKPKYLLMENVSALVSQKFLPFFNKWLLELDNYGYKSYAKVLNAKDYGVPQNRERVFVVSILDENASFYFPEPFKLDKRLKDVLEEKVDEKFYLKAGNTGYNSYRLNDMIPELPQKDCIFDTRHKSCNTTDDVMFTVTTRTDTCNQQFLKEYSKETICINSKVNGKQPSLQDRIYDTNGVMTAVTTSYQPNIAEPQIKQVGNIVKTGNWDNPQRGRIYSADGLCPALNTVAGGNLEPKIIEPTIVDDTYKNRDARLYNEVSPTLRSEREGLKVVEPNDFEDTEDYIESLPRKEFYGTDADTKAHEYLNGLSNEESHEQQEIQDKQDYRIRKLTPRECFRLMGVDDTDIDKIQSAGISNSQQYKLAGNSIVVDVLYHIFRKMFIDKENENDQLSLF